MGDLKLGILLWNQVGSWKELADVAPRIDQLGYEHLWTWDHLYAIYGEPHQDFLEGWSLLAAWAALTQRVRLGLLVGANTFRNPGLVAKTVTTLDHISDGRAILGVGGAWFELEHRAHGIEFGSGFGERLTWMHEAVGAMRAILDGETVTSGPDGHYAFQDLRQLPSPLQRHLPIMIGGSGERRTLRSVATYADMWNAMAPLEVMARKIEVLRGHCEAVGRNPTDIEITLGVKLTIRDSFDEAVKVRQAAMERNRVSQEEVDSDHSYWEGTPEQIADRLRPYVQLGVTTLISEQPAPYDMETIQRLALEVKPLVDSR